MPAEALVREGKEKGTQIQVSLSAPLRAISATVLLQNVGLLCF